MKKLASNLIDFAQAQPPAKSRGLLERAAELLTAYLAGNPADLEATDLLGRTLSRLASFSTGPTKEYLLREACKQLEQVASKSPRSYRALSIWASAVGELASLVPEGKETLLHQSVALARRASQIKPGFGDYNLACSLSLLGNLEEAGQALLSALRYRPGLTSFALTDPDLTPIWEARPDLRASLEEASLVGSRAPSPGRV